MSSSALPLSLPLFVISTVFLSFPILAGSRVNFNYALAAGTQLFLSYLAALSGYTLLLMAQGAPLTFWDGYTRQAMCLLPSLFYLVGWARSIKGFYSLKEYFPLAVSASLYLPLAFYDPSPIAVIGGDLYLIMLPTGGFSLILPASLLVFACILIGINPPKKNLSGYVAAALTFTPVILLPVSVSLAAERAASILGWYDHFIHSAFPLHFNLFTCTSIVAFLGGAALLSKKKLEQASILSCIAFTLSYPMIYRGLAQLLRPVAVTPAPLIWLAISVSAIVALHPKIRLPRLPSAKGFPALLLFSLLFPMFIHCPVASSTSLPTLPCSKSTWVDERIDPSILEMESPPGPIHVILRFSSLSGDVLEKLNKVPYFKVANHSGKPAVYEEGANLVYGVLNASTSNWKDLIRNMVKQFNLEYVLLDRNPSALPEFNLHPAVYSVDADVLHALNITGRGVTVAVIDSGINDADPEITGKSEGRILYQVNFITGEEGDPLLVGDLTPTGRKYHGTFVARTIAGARGIAPHANLVDLKVQLEIGEMYYPASLRVVEAIEWCIRNKQRFNISVINLSMGNREGTGGIVDEAVRRAVLAGITVIAAAGTYLNPAENHFNSISTPGTADFAVTVGATQSYNDDSWAYLPASAIGPGWITPKPDVVAPGPYTSGSAPVAAGVAVLLHQAAEDLQIPPGVRGIAVRQALIQGATCHDLGPPGFDPFYGYGKVNALSSYLALKSVFSPS